VKGVVPPAGAIKAIFKYVVGTEKWMTAQQASKVLMTAKVGEGKLWKIWAEVKGAKVSFVLFGHPKAL
jgi:hypothetical protein